MTAESARFRAVIFPADADEPVRVEMVDASCDDMENFIGGEVEVVTLDGAALDVNANGLSLGLLLTRRATRFIDGQRAGSARSNGLILVGFDEDGQPADLPAHLDQDAVRA